MLLTPCGVDVVNTLLYHLKPLQLSFFPFFLFSPTLSEGYNTYIRYSITLICDLSMLILTGFLLLFYLL